MEERIISGKKNGMLMLILTILLLIAGFILIFLGIAINPFLIVLGILIFCFGWIPFLGLKVIKPQEALVLTLFGKYYGTLKGEGFYFVNPFCTSVNPAASTKLSQSGDVDGGKKSPFTLSLSTPEGTQNVELKRLSR